MFLQIAALLREATLLGPDSPTLRLRGCGFVCHYPINPHPRSQTF